MLGCSSTCDLHLVGRVEVFENTDRRLVSAQIIEDERIVQIGINRKPAALRLGFPSGFEVEVCYLSSARI